MKDRKGSRRHRRQPPGTSPGTFVVDPQSPKPVIRVISYGPEDIEEFQIEDPSELPAILGRRPVTWVNVDGLGDAAVLGRIGLIFDIHRLALEDVVNVHQRAKVEEYGSRLFMVARMVTYGGGLDSEQLSLFLGENFVLTFQEKFGDDFDPVRDRIRGRKGRIRSAGPDYLAYALFDSVVDHYFPVLEALGDTLETLEAEIVEGLARDVMGRVLRARRDILNLRRAIWPMREALGNLTRDPSRLIADETKVYFRDCYDHSVQILDLTETYRELGAGLVEAHLTFVSHRMNEVMKVLTIISTIFIPLTFVAGVYGMNFRVMPELQWKWGYFGTLGVMLAIGIALVVYFRRRGWLGGNDL